MRSKINGFSLIELLIAIAIISIVAAIAVPAYNGYVREARYGAARANMGSLRIALEDFRLDNGSYAVDGADFTPEDEDALGWEPDGDNDLYNYEVVSASTTNYNVIVTITGTSYWVRCDDRLKTCCDDQTGNASSSACPTP